ncbi:MAG: RNA 2',3'-cyclic phosphodiesterase [Oscillospiraceae bacterium]|nr:RNA 2',3'-cyclic phosphodiesterase [Oscillospiraceae bacterium]
MRLFIAVLPAQNMKQALLDAQNNLRKRSFSGHYTAEQNLHLTLSFIGEYNDPDAVLEAMETVPFAPFPMTLSGYIGSFGNLLWAGTETSPAAEKYAKQLRHVLAERGIPFDRQKFHPHITLLRNAESRQPFADIVIARARMNVRRISLMRSDFGRHGVRYTEIDAAKCTGGII